MFDSAAVASTSNPPPAKSPPRPLPRRTALAEALVEELDPEPTHVPQIDGLEIELEVSKATGIKLRDLGLQTKLGPIDRPKRPKQSKKQFLEEFQKEAGTSGRGSSTEVG
jgi:hypothetical protein